MWFFSSLHSSFLSFRAIIWSVCNDWKSVYTHTGTWANMRWQQKPNSCFGFYSPSPIEIHTLSHLSLMAYATRMVTKKSTRYPPNRSVCICWICFWALFTPTPRYSLSLSLYISLLPLEALSSFTYTSCIHVHFDSNRSVFSAAEMYLLVLSWLCLMNAHCSSLVLTHCEWVAISLTLEHFVSIHAMPDQVTAHNSNGWSETAARLPESVCVIKNANSIGRILLNFKHTFSEALSLSISVFAGCVAHQSTTYRSIDWSLAECQTNGEWQPATTTSSTETLLSPPIHGIDKETHPNECESDAGERKKNAPTRLRLNASRNGTRFNKILS